MVAREAVRTIATIAITAAVVSVLVVGYYERNLAVMAYDRGHCVSPAEVLATRDRTGSNLETVRIHDPRVPKSRSVLARR